MNIDLKPTNRGFLRGEFNDSNGDLCSIQESSAFIIGENPPQEYLWLGCNTGTHDDLTETCSARMHLNRDQVRALLPLLERFVETGKLAENKTSSKNKLKSLLKEVSVLTILWWLTVVFTRILINVRVAYFWVILSLYLSFLLLHILLKQLKRNPGRARDFFKYSLIFIQAVISVRVIEQFLEAIRNVKDIFQGR
ncbi:MAG: hypothetical protein AB1489_27275 [Acidobacteriota bacterium]